MRCLRRVHDGMRLARLVSVILRTFEQRHLSQRSYLLASDTTREAIVIDPIRWIDRYLEAARDEGLRITTVVDTHRHADYVSGARALAHKAGATLAVSGLGSSHRGRELAGRRRVRVLAAGDVIRVGELRLEILHTPQHSPDHLSLLLVDESRGHN